MDPVQLYYHRPAELDGIGFLELYSKFKTKRALDQTLTGPGHWDRNRTPGTLIPPDREDPLPKSWEEQELRIQEDFQSGLMSRCPESPKALLFEIHKRKKPAIVITTKYTIYSNPEHFYFHYLWFSGCWRSNDEIRAGQPTSQDALSYHGLIMPEEDPIISFDTCFFQSMIALERFSIRDIEKNAKTLTLQVCDFQYRELLANSEISEMHKADIDAEIQRTALIDHWAQPTENIEQDSQDVDGFLMLNRPDINSDEINSKLNENEQKWHPIKSKCDFLRKSQRQLNIQNITIIGSSFPAVPVL